MVLEELLMKWDKAYAAVTQKNILVNIKITEKVNTRLP
jgi:hypothetical protein